MKIQVASCVVVDEYERLLLVHSSLGDYTQWELPGAKIDEDESAEEAAVRGAQEVLGVQVRLVKALGQTVFETDGDDFVYIWFQAKLTGKTFETFGNEIFDDVDYFELEDLMSLALSANVELLLEQISSGEVAIDL